MLPTWTTGRPYAVSVLVVSYVGTQLQRMVRQQRYHVIKEGGNEIHRLVRETNKKLRVSAGHPDWKAYVDYINDTVTLGLVQVGPNLPHSTSRREYRCRPGDKEGGSIDRPVPGARRT